MSIIDAVIKLDVGAISLLLGQISIILGLLALWFIKINIDALKRQNETAIKSERNERFKNAIEQLGNDKNAVVLGGIYTLHRIAKEDESYIENVFNILCAYVRDTTKTWNYQSKYHEKPSEPIQTILNILCVNKEDFKIYRTSKGKLKIDFSGAILVNANLQEATLTGADLQDAILARANLVGANLKDAYLFKTTLTDANLNEANLTDANLQDAILIGVYLLKATLTNTNLSYTNLTSAKLSGATLTGANLFYTILTGANLSKANLIAVSLLFATLTDANLEKANLKGAYSSVSTTTANYNKSFEERIKDRIGEITELSGIKGYDPKKQPFHGKPIFGSYTKEDADKIIKDYNDSRSPKTITN